MSCRMWLPQKSELAAAQALTRLDRAVTRLTSLGELDLWSSPSLGSEADSDQRSQEDHFY
jgi:hypothetical protein